MASLVLFATSYIGFALFSNTNTNISNLIICFFLLILIYYYFYNREFLTFNSKKIITEDNEVFFIKQDNKSKKSENFNEEAIINILVKYIKHIKKPLKYISTNTNKYIFIENAEIVPEKIDIISTIFV